VRVLLVRALKQATARARGDEDRTADGR